MLVSNWAQNYWAVSTVAKNTLYDYKNVFGRVVEPAFLSRNLDEVSVTAIFGVGKSQFRCTFETLGARAQIN
jgi:hypothetical protein